jgi:hypothetical protein
MVDVIQLFAPLGLRFWDAATDEPVSAGLRVAAAPADGGEARTRATRTVSGVFAFHDLPGLRDLTHPPGVGPPEDVPPATVLVRVDDAQGRFLPVVHRIDLPLPERGVYRPPTGGPPALSPPAGFEPRFYLFSAPSRRARPGLAEVRARLASSPDGPPLAYALVVVETGEALHISRSDDDGQVAVLFPYPPIETPVGDGSPLPDVGASLHAQEWSLDVRVFHDPARLDDPLGDGIPELGELLAQRDSPVGIRASTDGPALDLLPALLRFGEPCILRTDNLSVLLVDS